VIFEGREAEEEVLGSLARAITAKLEITAFEPLALRAAIHEEFAHRFPPEWTSKGHGIALSVVVLSVDGSHAWLANVGSNAILLVQRNRCQQILGAHSALFDARRRSPGDEHAVPSGVSTILISRAGDFDSQVIEDTIAIGRGDWVVIVSEPSHIPATPNYRYPTSVSELRTFVERDLLGDLPGSNHTLLAITPDSVDRKLT
jgi:hypothetical protein